METKTQVTTYKINFQCPECKEGQMVHTGVKLPSMPPKYPHACNNDSCDHSMIFRDKVYPYIKYEDILTLTTQPLDVEEPKQSK